MKILFLSAVVLAGLSTPAIAQITINGEPVQNDASQNIIVTRDPLCRYVTEYRPATGVDSPDFEPGVNITNNRAVVPADMGANTIKAPERLEFNITVDVAEYIGLPVQPGVENLATIGAIAVENNQLYFNGEPLKPDNETALIALCQEKEMLR